MPTDEPLDIRAIKVYDPKDDGLDYETCQQMLMAAKEVTDEAAYLIWDGLVERVASSKINGEETLTDFLYVNSEAPKDAAQSYFTRNPDIKAVVFMDGKFHSEYDQESLDKLAVEHLPKENNAVPFIFMNSLKADVYLKERRWIDELLEIDADKTAKPNPAE